MLAVNSTVKCKILFFSNYIRLFLFTFGRKWKIEGFLLTNTCMNS